MVYLWGDASVNRYLAVHPRRSAPTLRAQVAASSTGMPSRRAISEAGARETTRSISSAPSSVSLARLSSSTRTSPRSPRLPRARWLAVKSGSSSGSSFGKVRRGQDCSALCDHAWISIIPPSARNSAGAHQELHQWLLIRALAAGAGLWCAARRSCGGMTHGDGVVPFARTTRPDSAEKHGMLGVCVEDHNCRASCRDRGQCWGEAGNKLDHLGYKIVS